MPGGYSLKFKYMRSQSAENQSVLAVLNLFIFTVITFFPRIQLNLIYSPSYHLQILELPYLQTLSQLSLCVRLFHLLSLKVEQFPEKRWSGILSLDVSLDLLINSLSFVLVIHRDWK